jgi:hypothetical protein
VPICRMSNSSGQQVIDSYTNVIDAYVNSSTNVNKPVLRTAAAGIACALCIHYNDL